MTHIPSSEIKQPGFHADELGFVFKWDGHFLRGIYPAFEEQARGYFDSGFIDEVVSKGLFPKSWISEFENEQFAFIIEHELITPTLYANEWNFQMLKSAALAVLDIASIAWDYGYNMIDCHKLNVMFKDNKPMFVDLGSFIPKEEGSTGWQPYNSFLRSYYYILDLWQKGMEQVAKRMMAPHLELSAEDYWMIKRPFYRKHRKLLKRKLFLSKRTRDIAVLGTARINKNITKTSGCILFIIKYLVNKLNFLDNQKLSSIKRKISSMTIPNTSKSGMKVDGLLNDEIINKHIHCKTATFINCGLIKVTDLKDISPIILNVISINIDSSESCREFVTIKEVQGFQTAHYDVHNPSLTYEALPEKRLSSDIVIAGGFKVSNSPLSFHNTLEYIKICSRYSKSGFVIILIDNCTSDFESYLRQRSLFVEIINKDKILLKILD